MYIFYNSRDIFSDYNLKEVYRMNDMVYEKLFSSKSNHDYFFINKSDSEDSVTIFHSEINDVLAILENIKNSISSEFFLEIQKIIDIFLESKKNNYNIYILHF